MTYRQHMFTTMALVEHNRPLPNAPGSVVAAIIHRARIIARLHAEAMREGPLPADWPFFMGEAE